MKKYIYLLLFAILLFACKTESTSIIEPTSNENPVNNLEPTNDLTSGNVEQINELLNPNDFKEFMAQETDFVLLDIRTPEELAENGTINGAVNVDYYEADFLDEIAKLNKEEAVYLYCRSGGRSSDAAKMLKQAGFKEVYDLEGGYNAWLANNNN